MSYFTSKYQPFFTKPEYKFFREMIFSITATRKPIVASQTRCLTDKNNSTKYIDKKLRRDLNPSLSHKKR
ncbi:MAG: hypothetical protein GWP03_05870 [Proteobacteria bacterium]|nr:hypothetical protein [Pseudomonadota bacterium]